MLGTINTSHDRQHKHRWMAKHGPMQSAILAQIVVTVQKGEKNKKTMKEQNEMSTAKTGKDDIQEEVLELQTVVVTGHNQWLHVWGKDDSKGGASELKHMHAIHGAAGNIRCLLAMPDPDPPTSVRTGSRSTARSGHLSSQVVVSGDTSGQIQVWDISKGVLRHTLTHAHHRSSKHVQAHAQPAITCMARASLDGRYIVSGDAAGTLTIWDCCKGGSHGHSHSGTVDSVVRMPGAHQGPVKCVTMSFTKPRGLCVSGGHDGTVRIWKPKGQQPQRQSAVQNNTPAGTDKKHRSNNHVNDNSIVRFSFEGKESPRHGLGIFCYSNDKNQYEGIAAGKAGKGFVATSAGTSPMSSSPLSMFFQKYTPQRNGNSKSNIPSKVSTMSLAKGSKAKEEIKEGAAVGSHAHAHSQPQDLGWTKVLRGHQGCVRHVHIDLVKVVSVSDDGSLKFWELKAKHVGRCFRTFEVPEHFSTHITAWAVNHSRVAFGCYDGSVHVLHFGTEGRGKAQVNENAQQKHNKHKQNKHTHQYNQGRKLVGSFSPTRSYSNKCSNKKGNKNHKSKGAHSSGFGGRRRSLRDLGATVNKYL